MSALQQQQESYKAAHSRLMGAPAREAPRPRPATLFVDGDRPVLPRNGTTMHYRVQRRAVDFAYAMRLVCDDRGITPDQMLNSPYCAAVAARHMLWAVMHDGGYAVADIARKFVVDHKTVTLGIASFRQFQQGKI